jgi:hypothetical protein
VERLVDLALLDALLEDVSRAPRYTLHPLVWAFAQAQLRELAAFEEEARRRWVNWYVQLSSKVGYCWDDLSRLVYLDAESDNVFAVAMWTSQNRWDEAMGLIHRLMTT